MLNKILALEIVKTHTKTSIKKMTVWTLLSKSYNRYLEQEQKTIGHPALSKN